MSLSKEWYNAELKNSESETKHRSPNVEYSFYNAVKTGDMDAVIKMPFSIWRAPVFFPEIRSQT